MNIIKLNKAILQQGQHILETNFLEITVSSSNHYSSIGIFEACCFNSIGSFI